jgi:8-amino-7-oxononanoate synthase
MSEANPVAFDLLADKQARLQHIIQVQKAFLPSDPGLKKEIGDTIPESFYRIEKLPQYVQMQLHNALAHRMGIENPFFTVCDGPGLDTSVVNGRQVLNFSSYNYLGLCGDPRVIASANEAANRYGTSASASRLVGGERPLHRELENLIAELHGTESAVVFVSGYGANVSLVSTLVGPKDLVVLDRLIHNSVIQGAKLSGATVQSFPHNDANALEALLQRSRSKFERVLIVVEGLYSMDGDICPLPEIIEIKERYKTFLMVDEAHSVGVLGATGRGVGEHFGVSPSAVDVWMGTLSKSFAGCGGYAAGSTAMVELMKFTAPGFVYSVGMPPPVAAASIAAIRIMQKEPERLRRLTKNGNYMLAAAKEAGLNTGSSEGPNIVPIILGSSIVAARLANALMEDGIMVKPIIFPAVEEKQARLRFFVSSEHKRAQLDRAVETTAKFLDALSD